MKVSTEIDNNFGYEKITQLVDNIPLRPHIRIYTNVKRGKRGGITFNTAAFFFMSHVRTWIPIGIYRGLFVINDLR
jgi:hypothetical protein